MSDEIDAQCLEALMEHEFKVLMGMSNMPSESLLFVPDAFDGECDRDSIRNVKLCDINFYHKKHDESSVGLSWSTKAAAEAEYVASISCSGHGRAYLDGSIYEGEPVCECYDCYVGANCAELSPGCAADADSGDPIFFEPFWMQNAADSAVVISGWHRMSYRYTDYTTMSIELEKYIRKMHSIVGNAVTEGRYLVFGIGSTQLLNAAVYALSSENSSTPSNVLASIPFYPMYKAQTMFFNSENFQFEGDTNSWQSNNLTNNMDVVEFVTSPNNPDGELKTSVLGGKTIYDHAYFWPHFTPIPGPSDHDLMIFTLSKLTGHAGTRFGDILCIAISLTKLGYHLQLTLG
nr:tryptophan aminotransferase-related protein 3-like [Tanacetum cinerariifolium]